VSAPGDYDNGEIGGMIGRGNRSKPAPVPLCPPQTQHAARTRTRAAAVGNQRLTAELLHGRQDPLANDNGKDLVSEMFLISITCQKIN
jgi:hypothetical protein